LFARALIAPPLIALSVAEGQRAWGQPGGAAPPGAACLVQRVWRSPPEGVRPLRIRPRPVLARPTLRRRRPAPASRARAACPRELWPRFDQKMAVTRMRKATIANNARTPADASGPLLGFTTAGAISKATRFMPLSGGLMAGPAVSLNGSPTVSPMTVAAWASL